MNIPDHEFWQLIHNMKAALEGIKETTDSWDRMHKRYLKDALRASDWKPSAGWQEDYKEESEAPLLYRQVEP